MLTDEIIIWKLHKKENIAFKVIFDKFYLSLSLFAYKIVKDYNLVDDFIQDAFVRLWENAENFSHINGIKKYLYLCVRNSCLNHVKHRIIEERANLNIDVIDYDFKNNLFEEELYAFLYKSISDLPNQSKQVMLLSLSGLSNIEIAQQLSISINTVKTLKKRSYKVLKGRLTDFLLILLFV